MPTTKDWRWAFTIPTRSLSECSPTRFGYARFSINLVGNAIKFTELGEVRMEARLVIEPSNARLEIEVSDTGIGMSEVQLHRLFHPFSQVDNSATRRFGGTGLGLTISKRLAEMLGGAIDVTSTPGREATFRLAVRRRSRRSNPGDPTRRLRRAGQALRIARKPAGRDSSPPPRENSPGRGRPR